MPNIVEAVKYTRNELVTHVAKRAADPSVSNREVLSDIKTVTNVINWQADYMVNSSTWLIHQAELLKVDLKRHGKKS